MNFYKLAEFLHRESRLLEVDSSLVCLNKLNKIQKKTYIDINTTMFRLFTRYEISDISQDDYLKNCSYLIHCEHYMGIHESNE